MAYIPLDVQELIARTRLGTPREVYKPHTLGSIIIGLFLMAAGTAWTSFAASLTHSSSIFGILFPLFGLLFVVFGLGIIFKAIRNRNVRAVVCTYGVVSAMRDTIDTFRWEQILTISHKVAVNTTRTYQQGGGTTTSTRISHTYTVHCHDGRKFVFDSTLGNVQDLAETIEVEVARLKHAGRPF